MNGKNAPTDDLRRVIGETSGVMLVIGGMIGVGIFVNPALVAQSVPNASLAIFVWMLGGLFTALGALIYGELVERMPDTGGEYIYLREAYGPLAGFMFGWTTFFVIQAGSMAAVAIILAQSFNALIGRHFPEPLLVGFVLASVAFANCLGARTGNGLHLVLGLLKISTFGAIVVAASVARHAAPLISEKASQTWNSTSLVGGLGSAIIPVMFTYGGWQTANFVSGEVKDARTKLRRALVIGILITTLLYAVVNLAYLRVLGIGGLAAASSPLSLVFAAGFGSSGPKLATAVVAISALAFISQSMLTGPRVSFAMARDGLLFSAFGRISKGAEAPVFAIIAQAIWAACLACSKSYAALLHYVVPANFLFFAVTAASLFLVEKRNRARQLPDKIRTMTSVHPAGTIIFIAACAGVIATAVLDDPLDNLIGFTILLSGLPAYYILKNLKV